MFKDFFLFTRISFGKSISRVNNQSQTRVRVFIYLDDSKTNSMDAIIAKGHIYYVVFESESILSVSQRNFTNFVRITVKHE